MCGISGFNWADENLIRDMNRVLKHRGPDDEGVYVDEAVSLGHVRLSIIDLSDKGHQSMSDNNKKFYIMHNGEVYNFEEIRAELERLVFSALFKYFGFIRSLKQKYKCVNGYLSKMSDIKREFSEFCKCLIYANHVEGIYSIRSTINTLPYNNYLPMRSSLVVLVFMGLGKNNCYSILKPLSMQEDVSQIHVVRDSEGP